MKLVYCKIDVGNFGDDMNEWFWEFFLPNYRELKPSFGLLGIGSIAGESFVSGHDKVLVVGSGVGVGRIIDTNQREVEFSWVRGPHSAHQLGLDPDKAISDPALLVSEMPEFSAINKLPGKIAFVPHVSTDLIPLDWGKIAAQSGMSYVSPRLDSKKVVANIAQSELVVTESLHGAIVADAFRIPWVVVQISPKFNRFKWTDWAESLDLTLRTESVLWTEKALASRFVTLWDYAQRRSLRSRKPGKSHASSDPQRSTQGLQEFYVSSRQTDFVRKVIGVTKPYVERRITLGLRRLSGVAPSLSAEHVNVRRKQMMFERIHHISLSSDA